MKKKSWLICLGMILSVSAFLMGCSGNESGKNDGGANGGKDTLIIGRGGDSTSLDPITTTEGEAFKVTINMFETLLNYGEQDTTLKEGLAVKWDASDDGMTYTLELRKGVKFHDGTDFNAEAVKYNFERWMNGDEEKFPYYGMFGGYKKDEGHVIKDIKVLDDHKIQFILKRPQAPFLKNLAMTSFGIASPAAIKKYGEKFREHPVGTGPYKFVEWKPNDRIVLEKNEDYWDQSKPKLQKIIFRAIPENSARLNALKTGEIDLMDGVNPSDIESIKADANLKTFERPSMNVGYLGMTTTRKPFDNKLVRQALNHAVDKQAIIDSFYGGLAESAKNPLPPSLEGYNDQVKEYPYDLKKAKELLKEAGYPDGFKMKLWAMPVPRPYMPDGMKIAEVIQSSFEKIGVKAEIVTYDWATYLDKVSKGEADAFLMGWTGDNGDPDNFIYTLLDKDNIGGNNYTYFSNDELHDILIEAQSDPDQKKRNKLYQDAQELLHEESPWVPLVHSTPILAGSKDIDGYVPHPTGSEVLSGVEFK
ncbi:ABC transporter substrate-binding protein [Bacillus haynesii]|uniref:ABC transporter substrate-binding protein n=1 Tax=Bacillus haynesii TaxID=1925021 RepID=UPI00227E4575|nr:ABC transporter substrate-binding protein [Bacillus haynesii]MCY9278442.1 ABC transporter substrate-binding protein [Bacillus haynesii]